MLSIDRVRTTTLSLLGFGIGNFRATGAEPIPSSTDRDCSDRDEEADASTSRGSPSSDVDPVFAAIESALTEAGYLDS